MVRRNTPRPSFDAPALITPANVTRHLWGDDEAGYVGDEVLLSSGTLHALIFTLPPGGRFTHSQSNRTVFGADEVYTVLEGALALINPETGEVLRLEAGESAFFRKDTWHHGVNRATGPCRVLEMFSPTPAAGMSSQYAQTRDYLDVSHHYDDSLLGKWPTELPRTATLHRVGGHTAPIRMEGDLEVRLLCSTENLTVTDIELLPGDRSELRRHGGDTVVHVTVGVVHINTPDGDGPTWWRVAAGDTFVVPNGFGYRLVNQDAHTVRAIIGSAPDYLPGT
jgi:uncharacterized cupin superfamily protein